MTLPINIEIEPATAPLFHSTVTAAWPRGQSSFFIFHFSF